MHVVCVQSYVACTCAPVPCLTCTYPLFHVGPLKGRHAIRHEVGVFRDILSFCQLDDTPHLVDFLAKPAVSHQACNCNTGRWRCHRSVIQGVQWVQVLVKWLVKWLKRVATSVLAAQGIKGSKGINVSGARDLGFTICFFIIGFPNSLISPIGNSTTLPGT